MLPSDSEGSFPERQSEHGCCFFLSYAHVPQLFPEAPAGNRWVTKFFRDLCTELITRDPRWGENGHNGLPGFMDENMPDGVQWQEELTKHLATCRIFIPLCSDYYFSREHCGKEWAIFRERQMAHVALTGQPSDAIVPIQWLPYPVEQSPAVVEAIQRSPLRVSGRYRDKGLYDLIRLDPEGEYQNFVVGLAEYLDEVARTVAPPVGPKADYGAAQPLFGGKDGASAVTGVRRLRITVAAADLRNLPAGRDPRYYGHRPEDWRPYDPDGTESLAARAEKVAFGLGYLPTVSVLTNGSPELRPQEQEDPDAARPDGPGLLLVDPWIVLDPAACAAVMEFDKTRKKWVRVLIPWNEHDDQTSDRLGELRARLDELLPWSMEEWRRNTVLATRDLKNLADFGHAMAKAVELAWGSYRDEHVPRGEGGYPPRRTLRGGERGGAPPPRDPPDDTGTDDHRPRGRT